MNKFDAKAPNDERYKYDKHYFSFFIWNNKVYPVGSKVKLTSGGRSSTFSTGYDTAIVRDHYIQGNSWCPASEYWLFWFPSNSPYRHNKRWHWFHPEQFPYMIESVEAEPISTDCQEYLDYIEESKKTFSDNHMNEIEYAEFINKICKGWSGEKALPERFKGKTLEELGVAPRYNDINAPGNIAQLMLWIFAMIAVGIFKDWYIQWGLRFLFSWLIWCTMNKSKWGY